MYMAIIIIMITIGECMALLGEPNELNIATALYMFQLYIFMQYAMKCSYIVLQRLSTIQMMTISSKTGITAGLPCLPYSYE